MGNQSFRTLLWAALAGAALALALASPATAREQGKPTRASQSGCASADSATRDARRMQKAMLCLHNLERSGRGLRRLRLNRDLSAVGTKFARSMVARRHFDHYSPGHRDHMDRIGASGYRPAAGCWTAGENLFASRGPVTARQMVSGWMGSSAHRQNILRRGWQDFGLGVVASSPQGDAGGLTVVALFGSRSSGPCG
jgi:uncharacterized protein YkwD